MSEYIIGDRITTQPYALTESDRNAVGIRVYGPAGKTGMDYMPNDHYFVIFQAVDVSMLLDVGETALTGGEIADVFEGWDNDGYSEITDIVSVSDWIADKSEIVCFNPNEPVDVDFALIFEGRTHMTTVTERIANLTISGNEAVKFNPVYPVIAIKGDNIDATLIKDIAADATEGVYSTSDGDGYTIIDNHTMVDTLYLTGTGDVRIWGGTDANKCPFTSDITGGEEQPWQPLQDGYSNFWFELTDDTLSPWLNFSAKNNDAVIDWGDGSGEVALDTLTPTHTYSKAGKYVVKVKGVTGIARQIAGTTVSNTYLGIMKYVELADEVTSIDAYGFAYCNGLEQMVCGTSTTLGTSAFSDCSSLKSFVCPNLEALPATLFYYCVSLLSVALPSTLTVIGTSSFSICHALNDLTIPAAVTTIGNFAFNACTWLSELHCQATVPPTLGTNAFASLPANWLCYVPVGTGDTYKAAARWSDYADHILEEGTRMSASQLRKIQNEIKTEGEEKI